MAAKVQIPLLQPKIVLGLQTDIKGNVQFQSDEEVIYPVGNVLAFHNFNQNKQKIIKYGDRTQQQISMIVISPNKKLVALCEKGDKPIITLYDTGTLKKRKIIGIPTIGPDAPQSKEFVTAQFSMDSKYLMAVTGEPDWMLYCYNWEKGKIECFCKALNPNGTGTVVQLVCNPTDPTTIGMVGNQLLRLLMINESVFRQWGFSKADLWNLTCCCWLSQERFLAGAIDGTIHFIESGEYKLAFRALDAEIYNFKVKEVEEQSSKDQVSMPKSSAQIISTVNALDFLIPFSKGFCYVCQRGTIHLFEKLSPFKYIKRNIYKVPEVGFRSGPEYEKMTKIQSIAINLSEDRLLVTCQRTQIYTIRLWGPESQTDTYLVPMGASLHHGSISHVALCAWKPIFITCGALDRSLRVWNYDLENLLFVKEYDEDIHSIALHPTGLYAIVGFSDKLRYMLVRINDIEAQKEFPIRYCHECAFSSNGHMFAACNETVIQIFSTISFDNLYNLKGHNAKVTSLSWSSYDLKLSSCGLGGAIYEWDLTEPDNVKRNSEYITKSNPYRDCSIKMNGHGTYAVGIDGNLKYVQNSVCVRDINLHDGMLTSLAKARSEKLMFVTGGPGCIYSLDFPFKDGDDTANYNEYKIHNATVNRIRLSYDDKRLISVSVNGIIIIWSLLFIEGRTIKLNKEFTYSDEILVGYVDLEEKIKLIKELTTRLHEMDAEHEYQLRTIEASNNENVRIIHSDYEAKIEELKDKIQNLETDHIIEINNINGDIEKMKNNHEQSMQSQELMFNEKLIIEYDKYSRLEDKLAIVRKSYNKQLEDLQESKEIDAKKLIEQYTMQLKDKDIQIEEINEEMKQLVREHELIKQQIEDDADREILELKSAHEAILREEQKINVQLRSDTMIIHKKYIAANKEMEELKNTVTSLQDDHTKYKQIITQLESDIEDLKREIIERDQTIQDKEKRIHDLKRKNQELEKFRFVLDHKIKDLKGQIEPKEQLIAEQKDQIDDMILELQQLQKKIHTLDIQIRELKEKLHAADNQIKNEHQKLQQCKAVLRRMQIDLHDATGLIQEPLKLKIALKDMYHRYNHGRDFQASQMEEAEAKNEFARQRQHLERTVKGLKTANERREKHAKTEDKMRVIEQSTQLINEANNLRTKYRNTLDTNMKMESILGLNSRFMGPTEAQERLNNVVKNKEEIHDMYKKKIQFLERSVKNLKTENANLFHKLLMFTKGGRSDEHIA